MGILVGSPFFTAFGPKNSILAPSRPQHGEGRVVPAVHDAVHRRQTAVHPAPPATTSGHQAEGEKQGQYGQHVAFHSAKIRLSESKSKEKSEKLFSLLCRAEVSKAKPEYEFNS